MTVRYEEIPKGFNESTVTLRGLACRVGIRKTAMDQRRLVALVPDGEGYRPATYQELELIRQDPVCLRMAGNQQPLELPGNDTHHQALIERGASY